ncbi:hypothetical protein BLGI_4733 [Brevibacillus laterosporus GI-9]|nr:hypothetical protein BLGI_4733 [Brevibacillus laterosporus GI-9]
MLPLSFLPLIENNYHLKHYYSLCEKGKQWKKRNDLFG